MFQDDPFDTFQGLKASKAELAKTQENLIIELEAKLKQEMILLWNDLIEW
jgi:hypothetical protein